MRTFLSRLSLVVLVIASPLVFASDPQWIEVRSPNFSVITDAGEKRGRDVALHFEQMRAVFGALLTRANVNLSVPLQIVAFRNSKEMRQVAPMFNGKPTELAGLFQGGQDRSFIMLDMSVEDPWTVVFHEYAHQLMDGNLTFRTDPWFAEGFAEYFSSIEVDSKEARVGKFPQATFDILQQLGPMKVADLFRVEHYSKTYNESGDHRTSFYATSSLAVHYLIDNQLISKLAVYFDTAQRQKTEVDQAIQAAFGLSPEQFDKALRNYLSSNRFRYSSIPTPPSVVAGQFTVLPISQADARAVVADIHAHTLDHKDQALSEYQEALRMDPNNASALRGVGYTFLQKQDFKQAAEYFRRAAQLNSKDPRVHYYYAMLLNREGVADEARSAEMKKELETAIALDPNLADAYSLLGFAQAASGDPEKGIESMQKAIALAPREEHYQFNLANIYLSNRREEEAITILRTLSASDDREVALRSGRALAEAEEFQSKKRAFQSQASSQHEEVMPRRKLPATSEDPDIADSTAGVAAPIPVPMKFLRGKLLSVDCSSPPQALLTVSAGATSRRMHVSDAGRLVVIGAEHLSCDWKNKAVAVNYRERADGEGDVVSLELQ